VSEKAECLPVAALQAIQDHRLGDEFILERFDPGEDRRN
jgi:hypothetical protein